MNHDSDRNAPTLLTEQGQMSTLDAFLFKDNLWELIQALMEEGEWTLPPEIPEAQFVDYVFEQMRGSVRGWVQSSAHYFLDNSEYFLSSKEALSIFDEETKRRNLEVSDSVRQAFLEFLYRDFANFCSQAISAVLENMTAKKH
jgi:hypothetical protein